ncbi:glycosyltransferase family 4 protein [Rhodohalobacter sp. 614A]|uniref:glycosyltransferase family 4 protein n=1 Tax=Rhodohalobacter sp. 614A TaxID=2908649 RepID=UPI001F25439E|nr:MraY family glycosyltransferase [Rhodohalobacter sp. 614A]
MEVSNFYIIGFCVFVAFWVSTALIPILLLVAKRKKLFDDGNGFHKLHDGLIPTLGGVAIFTAFIITFSASSFADNIQGYGYFISASIILFAAGLKDDLIEISPTKKLAAQFLATALIVFGAGIQFTNMGGVFGLESISSWVGIPLTFFTIIVVINAHNLIDGIDGLSGSIGVLASLFFGYWFYKVGIYHWAAFSFILTASILGFLWYNRPPAKIFMGDTGSLIIGFYLAILAVNFVEYSTLVTDVVYWQPSAPIIVPAVLVVSLYDTLRIFIVRALKGKSPFEADKGHVHHHLLSVGLSHGQIVIFLLSLNVIILGSVIVASNFLSNTWLLVFLLSISMALFPTNRWKRNLLERFSTGKWEFNELDEIETSEPVPMPEEVYSNHEKEESEELKIVQKV